MERNEPGRSFKCKIYRLKNNDWIRVGFDTELIFYSVALTLGVIEVQSNQIIRRHRLLTDSKLRKLVSKKQKGLFYFAKDLDENKVLCLLICFSDDDDLNEFKQYWKDFKEKFMGERLHRAAQKGLLRCIEEGDLKPKEILACASDSGLKCKLLKSGKLRCLVCCSKRFSSPGSLLEHWGFQPENSWSKLKKDNGDKLIDIKKGLTRERAIDKARQASIAENDPAQPNQSRGHTKAGSATKEVKSKNENGTKKAPSKSDKPPSKGSDPSSKKGIELPSKIRVASIGEVSKIIYTQRPITKDNKYSKERESKKKSTAPTNYGSDDEDLSVDEEKVEHPYRSQRSAKRVSASVLMTHSPVECHLREPMKLLRNGQRVIFYIPKNWKISRQDPLGSLFQSKSESMIKYPIFTPSKQRADIAYLNFEQSMPDLVDGVDYLHVIFVSEAEIEEYAAYWPNKVLVAIPINLTQMRPDIYREYMKLVGHHFNLPFEFQLDDNFIYAKVLTEENQRVHIQLTDILVLLQKAAERKKNVGLIGVSKFRPTLKWSQDEWRWCDVDACFIMNLDVCKSVSFELKSDIHRPLFEAEEWNRIGPAEDIIFNRRLKQKGIVTLNNHNFLLTKINMRKKDQPTSTANATLPINNRRTHPTQSTTDVPPRRLTTTERTPPNLVNNNYSGQTTVPPVFAPSNTNRMTPIAPPTQKKPERTSTTHLIKQMATVSLNAPPLSNDIAKPASQTLTPIATTKSIKPVRKQVTPETLQEKPSNPIPESVKHAPKITPTLPEPANPKLTTEIINESASPPQTKTPVPQTPPTTESAKTTQASIVSEKPPEKPAAIKPVLPPFDLTTYVYYFAPQALFAQDTKESITQKVIIEIERISQIRLEPHQISFPFCAVRIALDHPTAAQHLIDCTRHHNDLRILADRTFYLPLHRNPRPLMNYFTKN